MSILLGCIADGVPAGPLAAEVTKPPRVRDA
jgi:hypothetical protein